MNLKFRVTPIQILPIAILLLLASDLFSLNFDLIHKLFDVNAEANIPTWFSTILLFLIALSSFYIYVKSDPLTQPNIWFSSFWLFFSLVYFFFSLDEVAGIHEWTNLVIERKTYSWVYLYFPFALNIFVYVFLYFKFGYTPQSKVGNWILFGMLVSAIGGMGFELLHRVLYIEGFPISVRHINILVEEGLEMLGNSMILHGCWIEIKNLERNDTDA